MTRRTFHRLLAPTGLLAIIACDNGQAPQRVSFDVESAAAELSAVAQVFSSPPVASHMALAPRFVPTGENFQLSVTAQEGVRRVAILPPEYLGTTFALDDATATYRSTEMMGAPADALRFIIYDLDTEGAPVPSSAIGHADLTDQGVEQDDGFVVGIRTTVAGLTVAEYTASFGEENALRLRAAPADAFDHVGLDIVGRLRSESQEIAVDLLTGTVNGTVTTEFLFSSGNGATISGLLDVDEQSGIGSLSGALELPADLLEIAANGTPGVYTTSIAVNGIVWTTVEVEAGNVTVRAEASSLSAAEQDVARLLAEYFALVPAVAAGLVVGVLAQ